VRLELRKCYFLVYAHQAAVLSHIGRENGCQPPFDAMFGHPGRPVNSIRVPKFMRRQASASIKGCPWLSMSGAGHSRHIALSGDGIRSAAFSLGALQALDHQHVIVYTDYLSTVSGGRYFGSCVTAAMSEGQDGLTFGTSDMRDNDAIGATLPRGTGESLPLASLEWSGGDFDPTASTRPNQSHAPRQTGAADLENA
jgi:hypothetical protein